MKAITIRGIEPDVAEKLKRTALEQNKSLNQLVLEFIKNNIGMGKEKKYTREYSDLDHLFGSWDETEFINIQDKINQERQIDQDIWIAAVAFQNGFKLFSKDKHFTLIPGLIPFNS